MHLEHHRRRQPRHLLRDDFVVVYYEHLMQQRFHSVNLHRYILHNNLVSNYKFMLDLFS